MRSLSPSRAADFLHCPLLYRFRVIDRLPEQPSRAAVRGTVVHAVLEQLFDVPRQQRTLATARQMVRPVWEQMCVDAPELAGLFGSGDSQDSSARQREELDAWLASAEDLIEVWFTLEDPTRLEPAERELYVEVAIEAPVLVETGGETDQVVVADLVEPLTLRGYVDRVDVAPDGRVRIVDYKTGRSPREGHEARALFQLKFYALVLWRLWGRVPTSLKLVYLADAEVVQYSPDEQDLLATQRKVVAVWQAIEEARVSGDWRPRQGRICQWCDHRALCPAWGGEPPPLPSSEPQSHKAVTTDEASARPN